MIDLIKNNKKYLLKKIIFEKNKNYLKKIINILNNEKFVIISWLKNVWKTNIIKEFVEKTWLKENFFYFNKDIDTENKIKNKDDFHDLFYTYTNNYGNPKIIILQNITQIEWIYDYINILHNGTVTLPKFKIILIWNTLEISDKKEVEILPKPINKNTLIKLDNILKYWLLNEISILNKNYFKEKFLTLFKTDIFFKDIFINSSVKNINLFNYTLSFLAKTNIFFSIKELNKQLNNFSDISLKTNTDYIDFSIRAKILKRIYKYDLKTWNIISSETKYYFTDLWIRNSLNNFNNPKEIQLENLIFNELNNKWYEVYSWLNWTFDFSFLWIIPAQVPFMKWKELKIYIHISNSHDKNWVKSDVNKLLKIWNKFKKYLIVNSFTDLWITKVNYGSVEVMEVESFLKGI